MVKTFDLNSWAGIGPILILRVLKEFCDAGKYNITELPTNDFYAINYGNWKREIRLLFIFGINLVLING